MIDLLKGLVTTRRVILLAALVVACGCVASVVYLYSKPSPPPEDIHGFEGVDPSSPPHPSSSHLGKYSHAAVVSNGGPCAVFGKQMLEQGGSAVDAIIATMLCDGVTCLQNMGLGGGFLMTIYDRRTQTVHSLNARETAPAKAFRDMYLQDPMLSRVGGISIGVPGELRGYQAAWERFGKLPWSVLFEPTIKLCEDGVPVNQHLARSLQENEEEIRHSSTLRTILLKDDGELPKFGDKLKLPLLAKTLKIIASSPIKADELYNGTLTEGFIADIQSAGGIITAQDLADYSVQWQEPVKAVLSSNFTLYSAPPPGSGILLAFILRLLDGFVTEAPTEVQVIQRITEAFKHAYARRSDLGDPDFTNITKVVNELMSDKYILETRKKIKDDSTSQDPHYYGANYLTPEDHGTANIVSLAPNGDAVAATSTINLLFGSQFASLSTGIILNDQMDDFSSSKFKNFFGLPPSSANLIAPGKRPLSSMCPTIIIDKNGDVRLVVGSAGGTKITTSTAIVTVFNMWFGKTIKEAIDHPRFHHQLIPMEFAYEYGLVKDVVDGIKKIGHVTHRMPIAWRSCVTAITRNGSMITSNSDYRRPGRSSGF